MNKKNKKKPKLFFVIYSFIMAILVFVRPWSSYKIGNWTPDVIHQKISTANFKPFHTIKLYIRAVYPMISAINIIGNVVMFIPLGILFPAISNKNTFIPTFIKSFLFISFIEIGQLVSGVGEFDVDDIILNMLGSIIGYIIFRIYKKSKKS